MARTGNIRFTYIAAVASLAASLPLSAHPADELVGGRISEQGNVLVTGVLDGRRDRVDMDGVAVRINGASARLEANGHFGVQISQAQFYRVEIEGQGVFKDIQTFGNAEIADPSCQCLAIPAIELVAKKKGRVQLFFAGDTMVGRRFFDPPKGERALVRRETLAEDLDKLLAPMKPYIEAADLASVNLETVLADSDPGEPLPGKRITFYSPTELAHALKRAGIDYVTLGNNHIYDYQQTGLASTVKALNEAGLVWSGAGRDEAEASKAARVNIGSQNLSFLGYVGWEGSNGAHQVATEDKGGALLATRGKIGRQVESERAAGQRPIIQYHGGNEYIHRPSDTTIGRLRKAVDNGAPLALGHHPHLTMGVEVYGKSLLAPSLGNFLFDQQHPRTQVTYAVRAWLEKGKFIRAEFVPLTLVDYRPVPAVGVARERALRRLAGLSAERGTRLAQSGGHLVAYARGPKAGPNADCRKGEKTFNLSRLTPICAPVAGSQIGRDVLGRGDFELSHFAQARERNFGSAYSAIEFVGHDVGDSYALLRPADARRAPAFYTQAYLRDVPAGRYTLRLRVKLFEAARLEFRIKDQPLKGAKPQARWRGDVLAARELSASEDWQWVEFEFEKSEQSDGNARPFRPIVRFTSTDGKTGPGVAPIAIDDFELVSWSDASAAPDIATLWRATHVRDSR